MPMLIASSKDKLSFDRFHVDFSLTLILSKLLIISHNVISQSEKMLSSANKK